MNILVTGANGQLGNEMRLIASQLKSQNSELTFLFTDVCEASDEAKAMLKSMGGDNVDTTTTILDITNLEAISQLVTQNSIHACVNCAAWTNVDACETDKKLAELAEMLNAEAPKNLATAMKEVGGTLFHVSTDYVFGQEAYNTPCHPNQKGTPTGVYGATKLHGEQNIINSGCEYIILRTAWLYSEFGKNFCKTMMNLTAAKPQLKVVFDQCGTPTYAYDLAVAIYDIIENGKYHGNTGIYHYSNEGVTSWYDFTKMIQRICVKLETPETSETFGTHGACEVLPCHSDEFPSPVKRPAYSVLDKKTFKETFGISVPYWVDSLEVCIKNLQNQ